MTTLKMINQFKVPGPLWSSKYLCKMLNETIEMLMNIAVKSQF